MKTLDQLIAEYEEATGRPMDGTARGCLWYAWQAGKMEERQATLAMTEALSDVGLDCGCWWVIRDKIELRTSEEEKQAREAAARLASDPSF